MSTNLEIYSSRQYWLAWLTVARDAQDLQRSIFEQVGYLRELDAADLKAVCYALLAPRFQPAGEEFIRKTLQPRFDDKDFSHACELTRANQYAPLVAMLSKRVPGVLHTVDAQVAAHHTPGTILDAYDLAHEAVRLELMGKLKPLAAQVARD